MAALGGDAPAGSQTDVVVRGIKAMIVSGRLGPGSRLPVEKDLADELGVSRGSLREAVRALAIMGVLETRQGDGTYVTSLDARLLVAPMTFVMDLQPSDRRQDLHAVRRVLEAEAASRAALRITDRELADAEGILDAVDPLVEAVAAGTASDHAAILDADIAFHTVVARASGNAALATLIEALGDRTSRERLWLSLRHTGQVGVAHRDHRAILDALKSGQPDRARHMMDHHLLLVEDRVHEDAPASTQRDAQ